MGHGATAVRKHSKAGAQVLMVSTFSYLPFMIRSRPPAHGTVPTLLRVRFHFLEMPALTHDKLCLPGSHPVKLKVDVYHYRILVNTNTLETIPIHPTYILRFRVFQFCGCFISVSSKSWLPFLNSLLILPFLLISFHFPSFLWEFPFIWRSYFYLIVFFFIENHPCFSFLPPLPLFLSFDLLLEGPCKCQMVLGSCDVVHVTIFYVFFFDSSFL